MNTIIRPSACEACPYRKDVPSGVWSEEDYNKLVDYDNETGAQPFEGFACHAAPKLFCHGWAVVHGHDLMALRLAAMTARVRIEIPPPSTRLFRSGTEAAAHGSRDIKRPSPLAVRMIRRLARKHRRLRILSS